MAFRPNPNSKHAETYGIIIWVCIALAVIFHFVKC